MLMQPLVVWVVEVEVRLLELRTWVVVAEVTGLVVLELLSSGMQYK
jgi:hypothetical protein